MWSSLTRVAGTTFGDPIQFDFQALHAHSYFEQPASEVVHIRLHVL
jgi:hypothetical protein